MNKIFDKLFNYRPAQKPVPVKRVARPESISSWEDCHFNVEWSEDDQSYVATAAEYPSLSCIEETPDAALEGLKTIVTGVIADMKEHGETKQL